MSTKAHYATVAPEGWEHRFTGIERIADYQMEVARRLIGPAIHANHILDIGCGTGRMVRLVPGAEYVGVDLSPAFIEHARAVNGGPNRKFLVEDMERLPFEDGAFDLVVLMGTLESEADLDTRVHSLSRLLAPGGTLFFNVQNSRNLPGRFANLFGRRYRQRFWSKREVVEAIGSATWSSVSIASVLLFPPGFTKATVRAARLVPGLGRRLVSGLLKLERLNVRHQLGLGYEWQVALRR